MWSNNTVGAVGYGPNMAFPPAHLNISLPSELTYVSNGNARIQSPPLLWISKEPWQPQARPLISLSLSFLVMLSQARHVLLYVLLHDVLNVQANDGHAAEESCDLMPPKARDRH